MIEKAEFWMRRGYDYLTVLLFKMKSINNDRNATDNNQPR
jgi:hypothetical protein